jgi:hypothetical protein
MFLETDYAHDLECPAPSYEPPRRRQLTPKQDAFARAYVETGCASRAYRTAYAAHGMTDGAVYTEAYRLLHRPQITLRISRLRQDACERHAVNIDRITDWLLEARELAHRQRLPGTAVTAIMALAKLHGLIPKSRRALAPGGTREAIVDILTDEELHEIVGLTGRMP